MEVTEYAKDLYILDDGQVREFLIIGRNEAILIDTGFPETKIINEVQKLTSFPLKVLLTHGDGDHCGGLDSFQECYVHQGDKGLIKTTIKINCLKEKDLIEIGDYCFEVIEMHGHTYGSIAFLDIQKKLLIVGDIVQLGPIYMFGEHRNLDLYIHSLEKLNTYQNQIETILPSHNRYPLTKEYIGHCLSDARLLKAHKLLGVKHQFLPCREYRGKKISFYY